MILKARTMTEPTLTCPTCRSQIRLTESLAAPLIEDTRRRYEDRLARKEAEVVGREAAIRDQQAQIAAAREAIDAQVAAKVDEERGRIAAAEAQKAKRLVATDLDHKVKQIADLNDVLRQRDAKLAEAQQAQADLIKKQRELDDAKREIDLTIQKQVQADLGAVRDQAKQEAEAALSLRVREKEEQIASMQRQIEDLRRKAEQGSQQLQGEVQELALEALLRQKFPRDLIDPVPKGEFGGDLIQQVVGPAGQVCGSMLWEAKRTKNWADGWLGKVREDQRAAKADVALIVSHALPKGLQAFDQIDGVWVTEPRCAVAVAIALRESLIALAGSAAGWRRSADQDGARLPVLDRPAVSGTGSRPSSSTSATCRPTSTANARGAGPARRCDPIDVAPPGQAPLRWHRADPCRR
jgi:hypothetical protein